MFNVFVFIIASIILLSKIKSALNATQKKIETDFHRSLAPIRLKLDELAKQIALGMVKPQDPSDSSDSSEIPKTEEGKKQSQEIPQKPAAILEKKPEIPFELVQEKKVAASYAKEPRIISEEIIKAPRQKTKFEESINDILNKIWNWILVGEEYRNKNISIEYAVASTWLMRLGVIALVICIGYFLKWSMAQGLLGPSGRIALSIIAGISMIVLGIKNLNKKYDILGQGFLGGGLAALYFSMYAAGPLYNKIPFPGTFALMFLITIVAGIMSYRFNSQLIAIFGIVGGFCTPIILRTTGVSPVGLYVYMLILSFGILSIAHVRNWRLLNYLGFMFTWVLVFFSFSEYQIQRDFIGTITCLTLLFVLHGMIIYYYNLIKSKKSSNLEIIHMLFNSLFFAGTSYELILDAHGRPWPAVMAVGVAIFYMLQIYVFLKNRSQDRNLLICLIGVAGFFTVWAVPLIVQKETIAICWALQAFFFLWIGLKLNSNLLINLSHILYLMVVGRLVYIDIPGKFSGYSWEGYTMRDYWPVFFDRISTFGLVIASFFSAFYLHKRKVKQLEDFTVRDETNSKLVISSSASQEIMFWGAVAFMSFILYLEFFQMFTFYALFQMPVLTLLCCILGGYILYNYFSTKRKRFLSVAIVIMIFILGKLFFCDYSYWLSGMHGYIYKQGSVLTLLRFFDYAVVFMYIIGLMHIVSPKKDLVFYRKAFTFMSTALLFVYVSLETNTFFYWYLRSFQEGAISVVWALFAISYLIIGIVKSSKAWRYGGLSLFVVVMLKVFFSDLADMEMIHRVIAFMLLGIMLLGGSFAYIHANKKFAVKEDKNNEKEN